MRIKKKNSSRIVVNDYILHRIGNLILRHSVHMTTSLCHFNIFDDKDAKSICNSLGKINSSTISTVYISDATDIGNYTNGTDSNPIL